MGYLRFSFCEGGDHGENSDGEWMGSKRGRNAVEVVGAMNVVEAN